MSVDSNGKTATHVGAIDSFRGAAALLVLLFHVGVWLIYPRRSVSIFDHGVSDLVEREGASGLLFASTFGLGFVGVPLFFVISGFCIHWCHARLRKIEARSYILRRLIRIYPLYVFVVGAAFLALALTGRGEDEGITLVNFLWHLAFWHYSGGGMANGGLGVLEVLWTISIEIQFYFLYLFVFPIISRFGAGRVALGWMVIDVLYRCFWELSPGSESWHPALSPERMALVRFGEWLVGAYAAELVIRGRGINVYLAWAAGATFTLAGLFLGARFELSKEQAMDVPIAIGSGLILLAAVVKVQRACRGAVSRFLRWIGVRSYTLYLTHLAVISVVATVSRRFGVVLGNNWFETLVACLVAFAACLAVADPIYRLIELPSHRLARTIANS